MTYSIEHCLNGKKKAKTEYIKHAADRYRKEEDYDTKIVRLYWQSKCGLQTHNSVIYQNHLKRNDKK